MSSSTQLSPPQLAALYDILSNHETYAEAEKFKYSDTISKYGYPFQSSPSPSTASATATPTNGKSQSPILQLLLTKLLITIPGVRDLPPEFWNVKFQGIMKRMGEANLSESYDKGALGTRKTLATAASVLHEIATRGLLIGVPKQLPKDDQLKQKKLIDCTYDETKATELHRAWNDALHELVWGNLAEELFQQAAKSDSIEHHSPAVKAAVDYAIIHIGTFMHHIFVLSPEGQYLLKLLENVHKLTPYSTIRQTLRVGNAATMMNGMISLLLAKMSINAMTNWMGLTDNPDDGMNLLQRIISVVCSWDSGEFKKGVSKVETAKGGPSKEQLAALREHVTRDRKAQDAMREISIAQNKSIVVAILDSTDPKLAKDLSESQHKQCLDYYSAQLSIRDREEITKAMCKQSPDLFTGACRDAVSAFDPMIRSIHQGVDLRDHITSMENFLNDFLETSRPKKADKKVSGDKTPITPPSVEDYVMLLRRSRSLMYKYLRQFADKCPDLREQYGSWAKEAVKEFRNNQSGKKGVDSSQDVDLGAGALNDKLQDLFSKVPEKSQAELLPTLDNHVEYLSAINTASQNRMQAILDSLATNPDAGLTSSTTTKPNKKKDKTANSSDSNKVTGGNSQSGPGVYLTRWTSLLDATLITPATLKGEVRLGKDVKNTRSQGKPGARESDSVETAPRTGGRGPVEGDVSDAPPDVSAVVEALREPFRELLAGMSGSKNTTLATA